MYYGALEAGGTKMVCAIGDADKNIIDRYPYRRAHLTSPCLP